MSEMIEDDELGRLGRTVPPKPSGEARARALGAAMAAFDEKVAPTSQGSAARSRLTAKAIMLWRTIMSRKLLAAPAVAALVALPIAGYATFYLMERSPFAIPVDGGGGTTKVTEPAPRQAVQPTTVEPRAAQPRAEPQMAREDGEASAYRQESERDALATLQAAPPPATGIAGHSRAIAPGESAADSRLMAPAAPAIDMVPPQAESRDRLAEFDSNPVRSALESPVSTFSIDVDTASYAFVRRSLKEGFLPQPDTVRVEEMVNYFPYDWAGPAEAGVPFNTIVTVMPTPWNADTKLLHLAIKGFDLQPADRPRANLVFLIDVSGSMAAADKLPLLKSSFRLLVNQMTEQDTVSIVTYAGNAGTVLEPTKGSNKAKILAALDRLESGGSTAGEAGLREAYRLAQASFVEGGVNRVMLATDGDFNVGQTDDGDLKRLIENKRESGVFLSVLGFGRGNLNDQMMQEIAQNGNGHAAYIDTLAEAEKALVQEAGSTLFPIAKDVKIQVEFNPERIAEYRLIGYETRALNREDFNNDRVDAGEIGSGHSVTAIYEITPKGSPATIIDDLRYGQGATDRPAGVPNDGEYAFVKIRYKLPTQDTSQLITTPVTSSNEIDAFDAAGADQRFSVAVAAFGQKLRGADQTDGFGYDRIAEIATAARGADPFGYRAEFLSLVRLASALDGRQ